MFGAVFFSPMLSDFYGHLTFPSLMWLCSHLSRLDRVRRDDDQKNRGSKKAQDAEQSLLNKVGVRMSPCFLYIAFLIQYAQALYACQRVVSKQPLSQRPCSGPPLNDRS
jgi:hypothetical protein